MKYVNPSVIIVKSVPGEDSLLPEVWVGRGVEDLKIDCQNK